MAQLQTGRWPQTRANTDLDLKAEIRRGLASRQRPPGKSLKPVSAFKSANGQCSRAGPIAPENKCDGLSASAATNGWTMPPSYARKETVNQIESERDKWWQPPVP